MVLRVAWFHPNLGFQFRSDLSQDEARLLWKKWAERRFFPQQSAIYQESCRFLVRSNEKSAYKFLKIY